MSFFEKPISQLEESDLIQLMDEQVPESLLLEYKQDFPQKKSVEASVAAFANSHGGRLLVGVESRKNPNIITALPGLDPATNPQQILTNKVRDGVRPVPMFDSHPIDLSNGRIVLVVDTPESPLTPHILSGSGQIYVRRPGSSDPSPADDRVNIDRLYARNERTNAEADLWLDGQVRTFDEQRRNAGVLHLLSLAPIWSGSPLIPNLFRKSVRDQMFSVFTMFQGDVLYRLDQTGISIGYMNKQSWEGIQLRLDQNGGVSRAVYATVESQDSSRYSVPRGQQAASQAVHLSDITYKLKEVLQPHIPQSFL